MDLNISSLKLRTFVPDSECYYHPTYADCCILILSRSQCVILSKHVPIAAFLFCPSLRVLFSANMCQLLHSYFVPVSGCHSQQTCANCCIPICPGLRVLFSANMCQLLHSYFVSVSVCYYQQTCANCCIPILSRSQGVNLSKHVPIAAFLFVPVSVCYSQQTCANCCIPICPGLSVLFSANMCQLLHSYFIPV